MSRRGGPRGRGRRAGLAGCVAWLALVSVEPADAATPPPLRVKHAAVASDNAEASAAGLAALEAGGNAVDAACATALALGVVHPFASGIGGGGFALVYRAKDRQVVALDFRERAPAAIRAEMFLRDGKADPKLSREGGLAVGVPGEVRGLGELVRRFGKLSFARCVAPAEALARRGSHVSWRLAEIAAEKAPPPAAGGAPAAAEAILARIYGHQDLSLGSVVRRPDLATTLARLRAGGPDAFYRGPIADAIVAAVKDAGGVLSRADLESYAATERTPIEIPYRGLRVMAMPPPSSGGAALAETLGILAARYPDGAELAKLGRGSSAYLQVLAEALKHAFADRARHLGDPDFVAVPLEHLLSPQYHAELARRIKDSAVLPADKYGTPDAPPAEHRDGGTTHLSVVDAEGNAVALTTTVNLGFGARLVAGKTGVVLNDQMDDFAVQPGVPNGFGLIGSAQNAVAPGKRPLSSMTPTIVADDDGVRLVAGAAGGPTIITATAQVILNVIDFKLDAEAAIAAPRIHDQWFPEVLLVEPEIPRDVVQGLTARGQKVKEIPHVGVSNLIVRSKAGLEAAAEPRSPSQPAGY
jgi:gamma-glutamyltranspeptidase/glutathione hydrolase